MEDYKDLNQFCQFLTSRVSFLDMYKNKNFDINEYINLETNSLRIERKESLKEQIQILEAYRDFIYELSNTDKETIEANEEITTAIQAKIRGHKEESTDYMATQERAARAFHSWTHFGFKLFGENAPLLPPAFKGDLEEHGEKAIKHIAYFKHLVEKGFVTNFFDIEKYKQEQVRRCFSTFIETARQSLGWSATSNVSYKETEGATIDVEIFKSDCGGIKVIVDKTYASYKLFDKIYKEGLPLMGQVKCKAFGKRAMIFECQEIEKEEVERSTKKLKIPPTLENLRVFKVPANKAISFANANNGWRNSEVVGSIIDQDLFFCLEETTMIDIKNGSTSDDFFVPLTTTINRAVSGKTRRDVKDVFAAMDFD